MLDAGAAAFTVRLTVAVWLRPPDIPVIVIVLVPVVAVLLAANVRLLVLAVGFVPNVAVTPLGIVDVDNVTIPAKPFCGVTVIVSAPLLLPCVAVKLAADPDRPKFGAGAGAFTVRLTVAVWLRPPDIPVIVIVLVP